MHGKEAAERGVGVIACLIAASPTAQADDFLRGPPPGERPVEVLMGFNLVNITDVGEKEETIDFDAAIYLEWVDPRQAYDPADYGMPETRGMMAWNARPAR